MAKITLAQGSSVTLSLGLTDSIRIESNRTGSAIVEAVTGIDGYQFRKRIVNHAGGTAEYGPFGSGTVKLSAVGGDIVYEQGNAESMTGLGAPEWATDASGNVTGLVGPSGDVVFDTQTDRVNVERYWASPAPADESSALQAAINANPGKEIFFHQARHTFKSTIAVSNPGTTFIGVNGERVSSNGTELRFEPETPQPFFKIGTDDGLPWDSNNYNGVQKTTFRGLDLQMFGTLRSTNLALSGQYAAGINGIEDWRGGHVRIDDCIIEGFENNFWGIQSDFNHFTNITSLYSRNGIYAGPKSDQFTIDDLYSFNCDTALTIDQASMVVVNRPKMVICGSTTRYPVDVKQGSVSVIINNPWCENFSGITAQRGFFGVGVNAGYSSTAAVGGFEVNSPIIGTGTGSPGSVLYLVVLGKAFRTVLRLPSAGSGISAFTNLTSLAAFETGFDHSTSGSSLHAFLADNYTVAKTYVNLGTGIAAAFIDRQTAGAHHVANTNGRFSVFRLGGATGAEELRMTTDNSPGQVMLVTPTYTGGQVNRIKLARAFQQATAMPTSGTWEAGDYVKNQSPSELGTAPNKYVILGWQRLTTGSAHVLNTDWVQCRVLTGN